MFKSFLADRRGNYAMMTAIVMVPVMGGLAISIDYAEMTREKVMVLNALDAANISTARRYIEGATDDVVKAYAKQFFLSNLRGINPTNVNLEVLLPNNNIGGGTMKMTATLNYKPYFLPVFTSLLGDKAIDHIKIKEVSEVRLKNTLEVALVLDNSGSMSDKGGSSGKVRMDLLKDAAKQLVDTLAAQADQMKQVPKPVQFGLVPFASSVNVGPQHANETWMDLDGLSPIHHENFDWSTMNSSYSSTKYVQKSGGVWYKKGSGWGAEENKKITRFTMYDDVKRISGYTFVKTGQEWGCIKTNTWGQCTQNGWKDVGYDAPVYVPFASWKGCVETRPHPYNVNDAAPTASTPATLYVPMYGPDESSRVTSYNSWWPDVLSTTNDANRQKYMPKYFTPQEQAGESIRASDNVIVGPNQSCTTKPITPLTDVSALTGKTAIKNAIDAMQPLGGTNVPDGMAWGWRVVSSGAPFTEGRPETEKGNDKVLIVVTDGANTYYTPGSLGWSDGGNNKSIYSSVGYAGKNYDTTSKSRLFRGTTQTVTYDNAIYTNAMNEHFQELCTNAKAANIMVMTVALDLDSKKAAEAKQIEILQSCASNSRYRTGADGKPVKLFWNSTGSTLADDFKKIGDELSNLRIVS
jgi:Flp pilus assembly protein TadG